MPCHTILTSSNEEIRLCPKGKVEAIGNGFHPPKGLTILYFFDRERVNSIKLFKILLIHRLNDLDR